MTTDGKQALASLDEKKAAIRGVLADLAGAAEAAGLPWVARDVRDTRLPKLDDERFSVVVLGEFNHGKSTFINALLGARRCCRPASRRRPRCSRTSRTAPARAPPRSPKRASASRSTRRRSATG